MKRIFYIFIIAAIFVACGERNNPSDIENRSSQDVSMETDGNSSSENNDTDNNNNSKNDDDMAVTDNNDIKLSDSSVLESYLPVFDWGATAQMIKPQLNSKTTIISEEGNTLTTKTDEVITTYYRNRIIQKLPSSIILQDLLSAAGTVNSFDQNNATFIQQTTTTIYNGEIEAAWEVENDYITIEYYIAREYDNGTLGLSNILNTDNQLTTEKYICILSEDGIIHTIDGLQSQSFPVTIRGTEFNEGDIVSFRAVGGNGVNGSLDGTTYWSQVIWEIYKRND